MRFAVVVDTRTRAAAENGAVAQQPDYPMAPYAALATAFVGGFTALLFAGRGQLPDRFAASDLMLASLATHKLSRLISRDRVTRPTRKAILRPSSTLLAILPPRVGRLKRAIPELRRGQTGGGSISRTSSVPRGAGSGVLNTVRDDAHGSDRP